jgi:hypothetical protein
MWQAAHTENERMKDVLHKAVRQLRQHEALSDAMDRAEQKQIGDYCLMPNEQFSTIQWREQATFNEMINFPLYNGENKLHSMR